MNERKKERKIKNYICLNDIHQAEVCHQMKQLGSFQEDLSQKRLVRFVP